MRPLALAALGVGALLLTVGAAQADTPPAIKTQPGNSAPVPAAGKTSFTADEAKSRMEKRGYQVQSDPVKGANGIWYADDKKPDGSEIKLLVDFQGNVFERPARDMPAAGKTMLTADNARETMMKRGYNVLSNPIKDDNGIWYAEGSRDNGQTVQVMVDPQGSVFESGEYSGHPSSAPGAEPTLPNPVKKAPPADEK